MQLLKRLVRDQKGAAMTQAVIVIPIFILMWLGIIALHHLYAAKLQAQTTAHALTLKMAVAGECGSDDTKLEDFDTSAATDIDDDSQELIGGVAGCQPFSWSHSYGKGQVTAHGVPELFGGPERTMTSENMMMCNMKPVDGLTDLVAGLVTEMLGID